MSLAADVESETERLRRRYEVFIVGRARNHLKVVLSLDISLLYLLRFRHPSRSSVVGDANCMYFLSMMVTFSPLHCDLPVNRFVYNDVPARSRIMTSFFFASISILFDDTIRKYSARIKK